MARLRICDLTTLFIEGGEGGVNTYLYEKSKYLHECVGDEFEHQLIVPTQNHCVKSFGASTLYGIASPRYFRNPQHRVIFNHRAVREILRKIKPDLIEIDCASLLGRVAARALLERPPRIVGFYHVHLPTYYARPFLAPLGEWAAAAAERLAWSYVRICASPCERVLVASATVREQLARHGFPPLEAVPLGVDTELFHPPVVQASAVGTLNAVEDPQAVPRILYVGRLSYEKNLPLLFEAYERLCAKRPYRLCVIGDGPLRKFVQNYASTHPNVDYLGEVAYGERLAEHYRAADVLALPSPSETFGLIVLEALASGIPVVAVRQGGPTELLRDGVGGFARPGDAADFAAKIETALAQRKPAAVYRAAIRERYSWQQTFTRVVAIYRDVLRGPAVDTDECRAQDAWLRA